MAERTKHLFQFRAGEIAEAAETEAEYHNERRAFWTHELETSTARVQETAGVKVTMVEQTGGPRADVVIDYGDPAAYKRMQEAATKIREHQIALERFLSDAKLYVTQGDRTYELDAEDVAHFRLNGSRREQ